MVSNDETLRNPFVRLIRFSEKEITTGPLLLRYNRAHKFIIAASPINLPPTFVLIDIVAGTATAVTPLVKQGGGGGSGHLWVGTVTNGMLTGKKEYLLRVSDSTGVAHYEIEIKNNRRA